MEQSNQPQQKKSPIELAFNVLVVLLIAGAILQALQVSGLRDRVANLEAQLLAQAEADIAEQLGTNNDGWNTVIKSGLGGFEVTLPNGWGPIYNDLERDFIIMPGTRQPDLGVGKKVEVIESQGYGSDGPTLFAIWIVNKGEAELPQGDAEEFTFSNNKNPIKGTKYTYTYPEDRSEGIGYLRLQDDRRYEYVVPFGDKELHVYYNVYGSDPRNLVETVEEIVQRIVLAE